MNLKKGCRVMLISGQEKGKSGAILEKVKGASFYIVEGLNKKLNFNKRVSDSSKRYLWLESPIKSSKLALLDGDLV